jgi:hypothetical protein
MMGLEVEFRSAPVSTLGVVGNYRNKKQSHKRVSLVN